ncbi:MATE family efflux transporter [Photobacterium sp. BZF1]|uniref:MATE family efflux transporter n=1 Tax=Photobacterium sp. BZF1 TaxID=1904457 RepID=UPI001653C264|nr:MATE family efflux transporter [Photobacterium sp. BZF1]MBC7002968.1 MATE family efflux transporter [Photobacterium sp. BZF1]
MNPLADDLNQAPVRETFYRYLIPAVAGMLIKCAFIFIDTLFIGRLVGADALGAVSLVIPYFSVFTAIAMMLGIGGATWMSIEFGKSNTGKGQAIFSQTLAFSLLVFSALVVVSWLTLDPVLELMGAEGAIFTLSREYLVYLLPFLLSYSLNWVLSSFIRNDNHPKLAMVAMVVGALVNIVLDVIFIWWLDMGVGGAALATGIAQWVMSAILLSHFYSGKGRLLLRITRFGRRTIQRVGEMGAPSFFIEAALTITIVVFNFVLLNHYGEDYLIAYSLTVNLGVFALFLLLGVAQACQPIISYNFGAGHYLRVRQSFSLGLKYGICTGLAAAMLVAMFATEIVQWFINDNQPLIALSSEAVRWYFISAPLMAANIITATYFQALAKPKQSSALSLLRGLVFVLLGLFLLPELFGDKAVWAAFVFAEGMTVGFSLYFIQRFPLESNGLDAESDMSDARDPRPSDQTG